MASSESARHHLYQVAEQQLGDEAAETLMELLPPIGWADVATRHDLEALWHDLMAALATNRAETTAELGSIRTEIAAHRAETTAAFGAVAVEFGSIAAEFGSTRTESAAEFGSIRTESAAEFRSIRTELSSIRAESAAEFGSVRTEVGSLREVMDSRFESVDHKLAAMRHEILGELNRGLRTQFLQMATLFIATNSALVAVVAAL